MPRRRTSQTELSSYFNEWTDTIFENELLDRDAREVILDTPGTPEAVRIKMADLKHNMDVLRLVEFSRKDGDRIRRYHNAYRYLEKYNSSVYQDKG